jgi:hypothetical protein
MCFYSHLCAHLRSHFSYAWLAMGCAVAFVTRLALALMSMGLSPGVPSLLSTAGVACHSPLRYGDAPGGMSSGMPASHIHTTLTHTQFVVVVQKLFLITNWVWVGVYVRHYVCTPFWLKCSQFGVSLEARATQANFCLPPTLQLAWLCFWRMGLLVSWSASFRFAPCSWVSYWVCRQAAISAKHSRGGCHTPLRYGDAPGGMISGMPASHIHTTLAVGTV